MENKQKINCFRCNKLWNDVPLTPVSIIHVLNYMCINDVRSRLNDGDLYCKVNDTTKPYGFNRGHILICLKCMR